MNATDIRSDALRSRAAIAPEHAENRFVIAMIEEGETVTEVSMWLSRKLKRPFHRNTVQGWYVPLGQAAHRHVPRDAAEALRAKYGKDKKGNDRVPLESWPKVRG